MLTGPSPTFFALSLLLALPHLDSNQKPFD